MRCADEFRAVIAARSEPMHSLLDLLARLESGEERLALYALGALGNERWSARELAVAAREIAAGLHDRGAGLGDAVALVGPNSPSWIASFFGIVVAQCTAVPLDEKIPTADRIEMLRRVGCRFAFASPSTARDLRAAGIETFGLAAEALAPTWSELRRPAVADKNRPSPSASAVIFHTSGTTGTPKAVPLSHTNILTSVDALLALELLHADARILLPLPLFHVYPLVVGLLAPLAGGAAVVLPEGLSGPELRRALVRGDVTHLVGVPRLYSSLLLAIEGEVRARGRLARGLYRTALGFSKTLDSVGLPLGRPLFRGLRRRVAPKLATLVCGGAALDPPVEATFATIGYEMLTGYGLTEAAPIITFNRPGGKKVGSAGRPVPGVAVRIVEADPQGVGAIEARGPNVFSGYLGDPEATKAVFTADRWLRTGDLGRLDSDGFLHIRARAGETIVLADGKKLNPEEVEAAYADPIFQELALLCLEGRLVAIVVPNLTAVRALGAPALRHLVRDALGRRAALLPPHWRASGFALRSSGLPRTMLGKLRRHLLPAIYREASGDLPAPSEEVSESDRALLAMPLVARLDAFLRARYPEKAVGPDTNLQIELGIDSLAWLALTLDIERELGISFGHRDVQDVVTVRDLLRAALTAAAQPAPSEDLSRHFAPLGAGERLLRALVGLATQFVLRAFYCLHIKGQENIPLAGACLICPNHTSFLDPFALGTALPRARRGSTYWAGWTGILHASAAHRAFSRAMHVLPIDLSRPWASLALGQLALERGNALVWFAEGARSPDGSLQPFLGGIGELVLRSRATVVPARIVGAFEAWPRHRKLPGLGGVSVRFGAPVEGTTLIAEAAGAKLKADAIAAGIWARVAALGPAEQTSDAMARREEPRKAREGMRQ
jgi:long-chain acyl-CoA synthetase